MQPGYPGQDPHGQQPNQDPTSPQYDPYGQPQAPQYGQPPQAPQYGQPPQAPQYGQPTSGQPYGQQPTSGQPYGQDPYAQQQQPYGAAPQYPQAGYPTGQGGQNNTLGLVSMILGIVSIPMVCCLYLGIPIGIAGVITGYLAKQKADQGLASNAGQAKAGLICGAVGAGLGILVLILGIVANVNLPTEP
ncbi:DUF4190 domain-containing protein [Micromonospora halotolerans]|uniref:DUF4190 domain-containing protein n=1 Tax=Micromonospora halotolerans TaxID=709879 RepID=A0ABZ0A5Q8_9ACTN|nr:DUF4190 domain-containing protein [Micromonospora halotolerans]WNM42738.1 DUF4190 domain-containing protein [Micromonospora halotolerans]